MQFILSCSFEAIFLHTHQHTRMEALCICPLSYPLHPRCSPDTLSCHFLFLSLTLAFCMFIAFDLRIMIAFSLILTLTTRFSSDISLGYSWASQPTYHDMAREPFGAKIVQNCHVQSIFGGSTCVLCGRRNAFQNAWQAKGFVRVAKRWQAWWI